MADAVRNPRPAHAVGTNTSRNPPAAQNAYTLFQRPRPQRPAADNESNISVNSGFFVIMVATTLVNWLIAEMEKRNIPLLSWVPLSFDISWVTAAMVLFFWNMSKGRRFYARHLGAISFAAFGHALAVQEPSFLLMQTAINLGIFFGTWGEQYYPDEAPNQAYLPPPVQAPGRTTLPPQPRPTRQSGRNEEYEL